MKKIYLDNAATTPIHPKIKEKVLPYLGEYFGNPSSIHSYGRNVRVAIEESRETVAEFINANPSEIYFTSGGTEADNFAIRGIASTIYNETGRSRIITSRAEHHAVLDSIAELSRLGFSTEILPVEKSSVVNTQILGGSIDNNTSLVSVMHVNNETGAVNDISSIAETVKAKESFIHVDAVQSFAKSSIDVKKLKIDSFAASGHKIYGLKGCGILYARSGTPLSPILFGGSQERNRRGGTENVIGIVAFAEAVKLAMTEMKYNSEKVAALNEYLRTGLDSVSEGRIIINREPDFSPYILSVTFLSDYFNNDPEAMIMFLDINGIAVSSGAACTSGTLKPSHVITAMGKKIEDAIGTIRFSFNPENTFEEIDFTIDVLKQMLKKFRK